MAKAHLVHKSGQGTDYEPIENLSMHPPYWVLQYDGKRHFFHFDDVVEVVVEGEEELIAAAQKRTQQPEKLAKELGLED